MISARDLMVLFEIYNGGPTSGRELAKIYKEGREAMITALRNLKEAGYLETKKSRFANGTLATSTIVTEKGYQLLVSRNLVNRVRVSGTQYKQHELYSSLTQRPNTPKVINNPPTASEEEKYEVMKVEVNEMGYEFFEKTSSEDTSDRDKAARLLREQKGEEYRERLARKATKFTSRLGKPIEDWTPTDLSFEFADRVKLTMKIPPWKVTATALAKAISTSQKKFEISNEDMCTLMDMFFEHVTIKKNDNPEILWKTFIKFANGNAGKLKNLVKETYEVTDEDKKLTAQAMERFFE